MSRLEEAYVGRRGRSQRLLRAVFLLLGGVVGLVGFASATASLVAGFGYPAAVALEAAVALAGALLPVAYLALFARAGVATPNRAVAAVGVAVALCGLAMFWARPGGWSGDPAALPPFAVGAYAVGLLAVFGSLVAPAGADADGDEHVRTRSSTIGGVRVTHDRDDPPAAATADGGTDEDDLTFLDE